QSSHIQTGTQSVAPSQASIPPLDHSGQQVANRATQISARNIAPARSSVVTQPVDTIPRPPTVAHGQSPASQMSVNRLYSQEYAGNIPNLLSVPGDRYEHMY